ncbi:MAG: HlyD family efflux transporter periplasmic adaptor subunit [Hydrogenophaga sp.]
MSSPESPTERLFRDEALDNQRTKLLGEIVLTPKLSAFWISVAALLLAMAVVAFVSLGSYTRRVTIGGQLVPEAGLIRVFTPQAGVVVEKLVSDGEVVKQGQLLYVLNSDRPGDNASELQADIARQTNERRASLELEVERSRRMQKEEASGLGRRAETIKAEISTIAAQMDQQTIRIRYAEDIRKRYQSLADQDYIARDELRQKEIDLSETRSRLQGLERDTLSLRREMQQIQQEQENSRLRYDNQIAQLTRDISSTNQQLTEVESRRRVVITAPNAGRATLVSAEVGQTIDSTRPLLTVVPISGNLVARLYAPSSSIGFVQPGNRVLLRYQAFPYQKFGQHDGVVETVSTSAASSAELAALPIDGQTPGAANEPVFAIQVKLPRNTIDANGQPRALQAGMQLEADILQERRKIYEWVLEPLFSVTQRLEP